MDRTTSLLRSARAVAALILALLLLSASGLHEARAQSAANLTRFGERQPTAGARMLGRAGAGIGGVADYTALVTNPAGLGYYATSQAAGSLGFIGVEDETTFAPGGDLFSGSQSTEGFGGGFGLVYRFPTARGSLVLAGGLNQTSSFQRDLRFEGTNATSSITTSLLPTGSEVEFDEDGTPVFFADLPLIAFSGGAVEYFPEEENPDNRFFLEAAIPGTRLRQRATVEEEGYLTEANFGGAVEAARGLMLGATLNVSFGTYRFNRLFEEEDAFDENAPADYSAFPSNVQELRGFDSFELDETITSDLTGANLRFGASGDTGAGLRGGLTIETPTFYTVEQTFDTGITTFFDETVREDGTVVDGGFLTYGETSGGFERSNREYEFRTPWRFGAGLSLDTRTLTDGAADLTLAADLELVDWTQTELTAGPGEADVNRTIEDTYRAVINTRLGAEYRLGDLALRAGFAYYPDARDGDLTRAGGETTSSARTFLSAGVGYRVGQVQVDVGLQQERFDDQYVPYEFNIAEENLPIVDEEVVRNRLMLGVSYSF